MDENEDVLVKVRQGVGLITLNRPKAINSLTHPMVNAISPVLTDWAADDNVQTVVIDGAGERGLCAGGDLVALYHSARAEGPDKGKVARSFWYDEYRLNAQIGRFPKPYVALMDGIVMGGGVGIAVHGSVRVVTDTTKMAMPEVGIGFIPDVGGTLILSRAPGLLGLHAALTGATFGAGDAIAMGFADHFVPHDAIAAFKEAVIVDGVDGALTAYAAEAPASQFLAQREWIDRCYAEATPLEIVAALRAEDTDPATEAADLIEAKSPPRCLLRWKPCDEPPSSTHWKTCCARNTGPHAGAAQSRFRRGHPRSGHRQGPQSQMVARLAGGRHPADVESYFAPADRELEFS